MSLIKSPVSRTENGEVSVNCRKYIQSLCQILQPNVPGGWTCAGCCCSRPALTERVPSCRPRCKSRTIRIVRSSHFYILIYSDLSRHSGTAVVYR
eukprot:4465132-Prymnesium_polylepis.1